MAIIVTIDSVTSFYPIPEQLVEHYCALLSCSTFVLIALFSMIINCCQQINWLINWLITNVWYNFTKNTSPPLKTLECLAFGLSTIALTRENNRMHPRARVRVWIRPVLEFGPRLRPGLCTIKDTERTQCSVPICCCEYQGWNKQVFKKNFYLNFF